MNTPEITTPCVVCATHARLKGSEFFASRGLDWPTRTVAGHTVHLTCDDEVENLYRYAKDGTLAISADGVARWTTNGTVIPADCAALFAALGLADDLDLAATTAARDTETAAFLADYRASQPATASAEEIAGMTAAFGPGETVVDIISGRVTQL
jgi:hypothetical protein